MTTRAAKSPMVYVPLNLQPGFAAGSPLLRAVAGVEVLSVAKEEQEELRCKWRLPFSPTAVIKVDASTYEDGARERLEPIGYYATKELPPFEIEGKKVGGGVFAGGIPTARWILTSLFLCKSFWFEFGPVLRVWNDHESVMEAMPGSESRRPVEGIQPYRTRALPPVTTDQFDPVAFAFACGRLESYYRVVGYRMDRLAVALSSLWSSLCTSYPEQAFVSLSVALEALLSTQEFEVTHQLAERAAILVTPPHGNPVGTYRRLKRLYATRSNIVHGRGTSRDGGRKIAKAAKNRKHAPRADLSLYMHPLGTSVPMDELQELTDIVIRLIRVVVAEDELLSIMQTHDDSRLDEFFLDLLLGASLDDGDPPRA